MYPVEGRLTVSGIPAAKAHLAFHPIDPTLSGMTPVAVTGPDGRFRLTTFTTGDGAPAGEYVVTVIWPNDSIPVDECADLSTHDRLNGSNADVSRSPLRATVQSGPNDLTIHANVGTAGWNLPRRRSE